MILNQAALKRQVTVMALLVIIVIAGVYCYATLPRESFPDITIPYVFVTTNYEGVSPEDMEQLITIPIERKLKGIDNVEEIRSTSAEGTSTVAIKFLPKVDLDDAVQKVRDKVDQAKNDLPTDLADDPIIQEVNFSDMPVIRVVLSGPLSLRRLQNLAEDIQDEIESITGVLEARITGGNPTGTLGPWKPGKFHRVAVLTLQSLQIIAGLVSHVPKGYGRPGSNQW